MDKVVSSVAGRTSSPTRVTSEGSTDESPLSPTPRGMGAFTRSGAAAGASSTHGPMAPTPPAARRAASPVRGEHEIFSGPYAGDTIDIQGTTGGARGEEPALLVGLPRQPCAHQICGQPAATGTRESSAEPGSVGELRVTGLRAKLTSQGLTLPASTLNREKTLRFARELGSHINDTLVPIGFNLACELRIHDHARGLNGWNGTALEKQDYTGVDVAALAHAVGGEAFGEAVATARQRADDASELDAMLAQIGRRMHGGQRRS